MSSKGVADVVFCLDASGSMSPCINGVRKHIGEFLDGLNTGGRMQGQWDLRVDYVAHRAGYSFEHESLYHSGDLIAALYRNQTAGGRFFTHDLDKFRNGLSRVQTGGNEAPLVALDCCLDFPWRDSANCHRVVIMMTDEPFSGGADLELQRRELPQLIDKLQDLRVMLFLVAPDSPEFDELASADRSEYEVVEGYGSGLAAVDFAKVLHHIGKSVSVSQTIRATGSKVPRGLYGQATW